MDCCVANTIALLRPRRCGQLTLNPFSKLPAKNLDSLAHKLSLLGVVELNLRVITGDQDPLPLLFVDGDYANAEAVYHDVNFACYFNNLLHVALNAFLQLPRVSDLRILEIGAGTGGTAAFLLPSLSRHLGEYCFTDVSMAFLNRARAALKTYSNVNFHLFDVERDPDAQGFATQQFDVVIAANVLHATRDLRSSLANLRKVLAPEGMLLLVEATRRERWIDITFGLTNGWWRFADRDLRYDAPLLSSSEWQALLDASGFVTEVIMPALDSGLGYWATPSVGVAGWPTLFKLATSGQRNCGFGGSRATQTTGGPPRVRRRFLTKHSLLSSKSHLLLCCEVSGAR